MTLSSGLGCVNFINGDGENWRVRCGWMYYVSFLPIYGVFRSKIPSRYICKKIRHFLRWADIRGIRAIKTGLN